MSSNINKNAHTTKLRGNEISIHHSQHRPNNDSGRKNESVASGYSSISNSKIMSEPQRNKCGGRGIAIQQLSESMSSKCSIKNSNLNFSNSNIERYFKSLQEENLRKLKEENEKTWGKCIQSHKST